MSITVNARIVLADCRKVVDSIKVDALYLDHRIKWLTAVTLLRTVGHVLKTIDGEQSVEAGRLISAAWSRLQASKPEPRIFWSFIDEERNNVLKEYRYSIQTRIRIESPMYNVETGERVSYLDREPAPTKYEYEVKGGYFDGRDQAEVLNEAISWWLSYLDEVDAQAKAAGDDPAAS
jgi:hypothetical protein